MKVNVTFGGRFFCTIFTVLGSILFPIIFTLLLVFIMDLQIFDDYYLPRVSKNRIFNFFQTLNGNYSKAAKILIKSLWNIGLINLFWLQHIVMANKNFKSFMSKYSNYYVFERALFIISRLNI